MSTKRDSESVAERSSALLLFRSHFGQAVQLEMRSLLDFSSICCGCEVEGSVTLIRIVNVIKAMEVEALKEAIDHPLANVLVAGVQEWKPK